MKNILSFKDFVNEGFWKDSIRRSKSGEKRLEDKRTNINDIKPVDLGFSFMLADRLLELDGEVKMSYNDFQDESIQKDLEKSGWRLISDTDLINVTNITQHSAFRKGDDMVYVLKRNGEKVQYDTPTELLWLWTSGTTNNRMYCVGLEYIGDNQRCRTYVNLIDKGAPGHILLVKDKVNEGFWKDSIKRAKNGEERIEDQIGHHSFTDGNGKFHKYGLKPEKSSDLKDLILKVCEHNEDKLLTKTIDLNIIDVSEVKTIRMLFYSVYMELINKWGYEKNDTINKLKFDVSGWDLRNCNDFTGCLWFVSTDIGIESWKINPDVKIKLDAFENSYYEENPPSWYVFDIKDWIKDCVDHISKQKYGIDKVRSKELGKKCYWVKFLTSFKIKYLPDNVHITGISNKNSDGGHNVNIDLCKMSSISWLPDELEFERDGRFILHINLDKITDDEIKIPKGVDFMRIGSGYKNIQKLPKDIPCGIQLSENQLTGHIETVQGELELGNSTLKSLKGCPKKVMGKRVDAHNCDLTDLVGSPEYVENDFTCSNMGSLKSLKGCPRHIGRDFSFYSTGVTKIDDFPDYVGRDILMSGCTHLESFVGLPEEINGDLDIGYCNTKSLEGLPKKVKGYILIKECTLNGKPVTSNMINDICPGVRVRKSKYEW